MTREEADTAIQNIPDLYSQDWCQSLVDKIYDDFEKNIVAEHIVEADVPDGQGDTVLHIVDNTLDYTETYRVLVIKDNR